MGWDWEVGGESKYKVLYLFCILRYGKNALYAKHANTSAWANRNGMAGKSWRTEQVMKEVLMQPLSACKESSLPIFYSYYTNFYSFYVTTQVGWGTQTYEGEVCGGGEGKRDKSSATEYTDNEPEHS